MAKIDAAEEDAVKPAAAPAAAPAAPAGKAITADEAAAKSAKYKAEREAFDAEAKKGMPKPSGILGKLFGG
jgi:ribosomal protein L12E/L44/L45/RPP1/RPP2